MIVYRDFMRNYSNDIKLISQMIIPRFNWRTKKKQNVQCKSLLTGVWFKQAINNMYTIWQFFSNFFLQIWIFSPSSWKFVLHLSLLSPKKIHLRVFMKQKFIPSSLIQACIDTKKMYVSQRVGHSESTMLSSNNGCFSTSSMRNWSEIKKIKYL